jgi:hypothetical protein
MLADDGLTARSHVSEKVASWLWTLNGDPTLRRVVI